MRVLFTAVPIYGHLLPVLPLAEAAATAGDEVVLAVPGGMAPLAGGLTTVPAGPDTEVLLAENDRRTGGADMADMRDVFPVASFFAGTRVDLSFDGTLAQARAFGAEVVVTDEYDAVGAMVAAALGVPLVRHAVGLPVSPPALVPAMRALLAPRYAERRLTPAGRVALVDPWPAALHEPGWEPAADRLPIRPRAYAGTAPAAVPASTAPRRVLVTLGTVLLDAAMLDALVDSVAGLDDVDVLAVVAPGTDRTLADARANVHFVGFVPIAQLLAADVSVVVAAGGAGTVLAALSHGIPMVLWPKGAEKPMNAERVAAAGAGIVVDEPGQAAAAVRKMLHDGAYRAGAERVGERLRTAPEPAHVWAALRRKLPSGARRPAGPRPLGG
ncbi:glycosyltransferase family 1 protein [Dactylosporangium roseum]|uniref:Glycosyltransferase family 1 protein n=1 Tax=Dactylosporangium roseum TaxID=47989 RepID=A0ABY5YZU2_9ACTN|nr:glycosyltransferase [Dactylosporangium roseum]UWZ34335.1 glycosyltransferase family 1 protein [Dactylosporangium roseum]